MNAPIVDQTFADYERPSKLNKSYIEQLLTDLDLNQYCKNFKSRNNIQDHGIAHSNHRSSGLNLVKT
jgi:hypothetical protein